MTVDPPNVHESFQILITGELDGELTSTQATELRQHLADCATCRDEMVRYRRLNDVARSIKLREPKDYEWERFSQEVSHRLERRGGFALVALGLVLLVGFSLVLLFKTSTISPWIRGGVALIVAGLALLFLNVLRQKLRMGRFDRYKEVRR